jgi:hypothetical protein
MKIFILQEVQCCDSNYYHSDGGVVVIARDIEQAKKMIEKSDNTRIEDDEWEEAEIFDLKDDNVIPKIWLMVNAGCC